MKTILGIDRATWSKAYDYENGMPRLECRRLEDADGLIVSQVPMPNAFAIRCVKAGDDGAPFRFNPAFRAFRPYEAGKMALRRYYDVSPLIQAVQRHDRKPVPAGAHARANAEIDCTGIIGVETRVWTESQEVRFGKEPPRSRPSFARGDVNRTIQAIQNAERQDKVLLACAKEYWDRYMRAEVVTAKKNKIGAFGLSDAGDIGQFFSLSLEEVVDGVAIRMRPNDFARPAYGTVSRHVKELVGETKPLPGPKAVYDFYDLWLTLRNLQRKENRLRLEFLPACISFNASLAVPETMLPKRKDSECEKEAKAKRLLDFCNKALRSRNRKEPLTREELRLLADFEPRLRHPSKDGLGLLDFDLDRIRSIYRRFKFM